MVCFVTIIWNIYVGLLHCALSLAAQCIVIGPVCGGRAGGVCYHDNSKLYASICTKLHGSVGEGSDHLQLIKYWRPCPPGKGVCGWRGEHFWLRVTTAIAQCLRLSERFFH